MATKIVLEESLGLWLMANSRKIKAERCKLKLLKPPTLIYPKPKQKEMGSLKLIIERSRSSIRPYQKPELSFLGRSLNDTRKEIIGSWKAANK